MPSQNKHVPYPGGGEAEGEGAAGLAWCGWAGLVRLSFYRRAVVGAGC